MAIRLTFDLTGVSSGIGECQLGGSTDGQKPNEGLAGWCVCVCVCTACMLYGLYGYGCMLLRLPSLRVATARETEERKRIRLF